MQRPQVRQQVFAVIVRQALAGAPWRVICAGPMQVNNIQPEEIQRVIDRVNGRQTSSNVPPFPGDVTQKISEFHDSWNHVVRATVEVDEEKAESLIKQLYGLFKLPPPPVLWCDSPIQALTYPNLVCASDTSSFRSSRIMNTQFGSATTEMFWDNFDRACARLHPSLAANLKVGTPKEFESSFNLTSKLTWYSTKIDSELEHDIALSLKYDFEHISLPLFAPQVANRIAAIRRCLDLSNTALLNAVLKEWSLYAPISELSPWWWDVGSLAGEGIAYGAAIECLDLPFNKHPDALIIKAWLELAREAPAFVFTDAVCFALRRPLRLQLNDRGLLHSTDGPAAQFRDGTELYAYGGALMPREYIDFPERITVSVIENERNVERRHAMIEIYGTGKYLMESGAEIVDKDAWGILYRKTIPNSEAIQTVYVLDATPLPDGTRKGYFLRVPPEIRTAKEAIAWTFGMRTEEFDPTIQT